MRTVALAVAVITTLTGTTSAETQDPRVDTFQRVCIESRTNYAASATAAEALGWAPASDAVRPELQRIFEIARGFDLGEASMSQLQAYNRAGEEGIFVVLSEITMQGRPLNGCYVYDFDAAQPIPPDVFTSLLGSPPNEAIHEPGIITSQKWVGPAALPNVATLRVAFVYEGGEAAQFGGFDGVALAITSMSQ
jgi:hypothetical protein